MNMTTKQLLKIATSGLTGRREQDIAFLNEQILFFGSNDQIVPVLKNILGSLLYTEIGTTA